ncbi:hypothetical protein [Paenibacillus sp. Root444D2]|uniref:hypothetical protein n=1 Tax=Paenibacillus sp. Root444D2 TaxID=1736538 RepID=UPI00070A85FB|nr:hypothetical protein [Paenibacillus sp. Root444D2]KQX69259.1 hypothetical protein ASD40_01795 [Paenibacillus sp. Root444D2]
MFKSQLQSFKEDLEFVIKGHNTRAQVSTTAAPILLGEIEALENEIRELKQRLLQISEISKLK